MIGVPPGRAAMVGDDVVNDVLGAQAAGLRACSCGPGSSGPRTSQRATEPARRVLDSIADLPTCWRASAREASAKAPMDPERTRHARRLFAGIAPEYDRMGAVLSFGQDPRWRRFLVSKVNAIPGSWVLDVATGTGLVARELARKNLRVVGLDQSPAMLGARPRGASRTAGSTTGSGSCSGRRRRCRSPTRRFDALTFTYLLRYVDDPAATVRELARVVRPGGVMASLEFHVPPGPCGSTRAGSRTRGR